MNISKIVLVAVLLIFGSTILSYTLEGELRDGQYQGEHSFVQVEVTVEDGKVVDILMLKHGGGGNKYAAMVEPLSAEIIANQNTEIDTITGATVSSNNLKKAVDNALEKAH